MIRILWGGWSTEKRPSSAPSGHLLPAGGEKGVLCPSSPPFGHLLPTGRGKGNRAGAYDVSFFYLTIQAGGRAEAGAEGAGTGRRTREGGCQGQWIVSPSTRPSASGAP